MREAKHLHEVGHRAFAAIVLPVGVGDEADGGVEGEGFGHCRHACGLKGSSPCSAHQDIENEKAADMKEQHGDRVGQPVLLALLVDAAQPIEAGFDRAAAPATGRCARR